MGELTADERAAIEKTHLAFEDGFTESPPELWRVTAWRRHGERKLRHTNWFCSEQEAQDHAKSIANRDGEVLAITKYVKEH